MPFDKILIKFQCDRPLGQISGVKSRIEVRSDEKIPRKLRGLEIIDACENGQIEMLKALLECGADIDGHEWVGTSGIKCRHIDKNLMRYYQNYSPLVIACYSKQKEIVKLLLSRNCALDILYETNQRDKDLNREYDALHAACRSKSNKEIIDLLMNEKVDWNYDHLAEELDCDKDMIAYAKSKRPRLGE